MDGSVALGYRRFPGGPPRLVALHGFSQTGAMFAEIAGLLGIDVIAPDLPGHGRSAGVLASFDGAVAGVAATLAKSGGPCSLLGYSQGGRVALGVTLKHPELVSGLILVSASAGIASETKRRSRRRVDESRAVRLESMGIEAFLDEWLAQPMFTGLRTRGPAWQARDRALRLENRASGLAAALRGMGQGAQPYLGDRLREVRQPVLLMAGAGDDRYVGYAEAMHRSLADSALEVVPDSGHPVVGERPDVVTRLVRQFLSETEK